jgi:hypothetical protein
VFLYLLAIGEEDDREDHRRAVEEVMQGISFDDPTALNEDFTKDLEIRERSLIVVGTEARVRLESVTPNLRRADLSGRTQFLPRLLSLRLCPWEDTCVFQIL